jgi:hypothetical protein
MSDTVGGIDARRVPHRLRNPPLRADRGRGLHAVIADNPSDREQIERIRQHLQEEARTVVPIVGSVPR